MAGTVKHVWSLDATNGKFSRPWTSRTISEILTGQDKFATVVATSTTATTLTVTGLTTYGWAVFTNLSETDGEDIHLGPAADFLTLEPGASIALRLKAGATIQHQSATGTPSLEVEILED